MFLAILDPRTQELDYVTAGHPPPLLLQPGEEGRFLESTGAPIAMPIPLPLRAARVTLSPGSLLAIWSDGIPEAVRLGVRPIQEFTLERLAARLGEWRDLPLPDILERVFRESDAFIGGPRAQDDRAMLLLRRET
jgi:sigma-B regulation protein RsbU (phosphoserine phosphatase)